MGYWLATAAMLALSLALVPLYAPVDAAMGPIQKLVYLHVPAAIDAFVACAVVSLASVGYVWQRRLIWDDLARAAAQVAVLFCALVLLTGVVWAKQAWGHWWMWSPRLTFSLILLLLYVAYLLLRPTIAAPERRALICAMYGMMAFLDVPLVYLSTRLIPDIHPTEMHLTPPMRTTMLVWMLSITMLCGGMIMARFCLNTRARRLEHPDEGEIALDAGPRIPGARP
jgi:heme exporter protein C